MQVGCIGLGRMGMNMARRLLRDGHEVIAHNRTPQKVAQFVAEGGRGASDLAGLTRELRTPRTLWLMLPAGQVVDDYLGQLESLLAPGDIIVDGGNSFYRDAIRRSQQLKARGIHFVDAGVSGGVWGLENGYCVMVGGFESICNYIAPLLHSLAPDDGHLYCGPSGAGHFVKMVHNGIEYAMMQAYGEGFALLEKSPYADTLCLDAVARLWNRGSVIRSWLLELLERALAPNSGIENLAPYIEDSGEGRWTVQQAVETGTPAPLISLALFERFASRGEADFCRKVQAALRNQFGGHAVRAQQS